VTCRTLPSKVSTVPFPHHGHHSHIGARGAPAQLRDINVRIPRNTLTVVTGLSGSGKSSLAFDTIYAEGQRRYVETLSAYARQFLDQIERPDVDSIEGLSPAIFHRAENHQPQPSIHRRHHHRDLRLSSPASTLPSARPTAPNCGRPIARQTGAMNKRSGPQTPGQIFEGLGKRGEARSPVHWGGPPPPSSSAACARERGQDG